MKYEKMGNNLSAGYYNQRNGPNFGVVNGTALSPYCQSVLLPFETMVVKPSFDFQIESGVVEQLATFTVSPNALANTSIFFSVYPHNLQSNQFANGAGLLTQWNQGLGTSADLGTGAGAPINSYMYGN